MSGIPVGYQIAIVLAVVAGLVVVLTVFAVGEGRRRR